MTVCGSRARKGCLELLVLIIGAGAVTGAAMFLMLSRFTGLVTRGKLGAKAVIYALSQFFMPILVLTGCALLLPSGLLWAGVGLVATLIVCALVSFIATIKKGDR